MARSAAVIKAYGRDEVGYEVWAVWGEVADEDPGDVEEAFIIGRGKDLKRACAQAREHLDQALERLERIEAGSVPLDGSESLAERALENLVELS